MKADRLQGQLDRCVWKYVLHVKLNYSRNIFIARQKSTKPYRHVCMSSNVSSSNGIDQLNEKKKTVDKISSKDIGKFQTNLSNSQACLKVQHNYIPVC